VSTAPPEFDADEPAPPASPGVYLAGGLGGLAAVAAGLVESSAGGVVGLACLIPGVVGLTLRRNAMPGVFLVLLAYFLAFPDGNPFAPAFPTPAGRSYFRLTDLVLVGGVVTYLACQYRLFGLTTRAVPADPAGVTGAEWPAVRVVTAADDGEVTRLALGLTAALVAGQLLWLVVTRVQVDFAAFPPVSLFRPPVPVSPDSDLPPVPVSPDSDLPSVRDADPETPPSSRFLVGVGVAGLLGGVLGFWAWYGRAARLRADQARLFLIDTAWRESRRELNRHEVWWAWRNAPRTPLRQPRWRTVAVVAAVGVALVFAGQVAWAWFGVDL